MSEEQKQTQRDREICHELRMRRGHAVTLSIHLLRPLLLDPAFEAEVQCFARHLPGEHEHDFDFARRPDEGCVDYAEALGHECQPGAEVGYRVIGILSTCC